MPCQKVRVPDDHKEDVVFKYVPDTAECPTGMKQSLQQLRHIHQSPEVLHETYVSDLTDGARQNPCQGQNSSFVL